MLKISKQCLSSLFRPPSRCLTILGIETSCDDTGAAVVTCSGRVLGEHTHTQLQSHIMRGGIIPPLARNLHAKHLSRVVSEAMRASGASYADIDALAVTVTPGLPLSLMVGLHHARTLCRRHHKPLVPVHHMRAHALTARMQYAHLQFPFLTLLISGGHCLLAVVRGVDDFLLLGSTIDNAPGEILDKIGRRMKLRNLGQQFGQWSGGRSIEFLATSGNCDAFQFTEPLLKYTDCSFSFAGIIAHTLHVIEQEEARLQTSACAVIDTAADLCASVQHAICRHLCRRTQRAVMYCESNGLLPNTGKRLVVSGGVACNKYVIGCLQYLCDQLDVELFVPPPNLCTDNGVMIAWNGIEKHRLGHDIIHDVDQVDFRSRTPIGTDLISDVRRFCPKIKPIKIPNIVVN